MRMSGCGCVGEGKEEGFGGGGPVAWCGAVWVGRFELCRLCGGLVSVCARLGLVSECGRLVLVSECGLLVLVSECGRLALAVSLRPTRHECGLHHPREPPEAHAPLERSGVRFVYCAN